MYKVFCSLFGTAGLFIIAGLFSVISPPLAESQTYPSGPTTKYTLQKKFPFDPTMVPNKEQYWMLRQVPITGDINLGGRVEIIVPPIQIYQKPAKHVEVFTEETRPLQMRIISQPPLEPFSHSGMGKFTPTDESLNTLKLGAVPFGKRLIVEYISVEVDQNSQDPVDQLYSVELLITTAGVKEEFFVGIPQPTPDPFNSKRVKLGEKVTLYADPGSNVFCQTTRKVTGITARLRCKIQGQLIGT